MTRTDNLGNFLIVVPDDLYETWITANVWADISSYIVKESDYQ